MSSEAGMTATWRFVLETGNYFLAACCVVPPSTAGTACIDLAGSVTTKRCSYGTIASEWMLLPTRRSAGRAARPDAQLAKTR
jgi:hypothetical protein